MTQEPEQSIESRAEKEQKQIHIRQLILCLSSGLLLALAFSTHATGWLVWFALVPWFYVLYRRPLSLRQTLLYSWFFGMGFSIGTLHWLKELHPLTWLPGVTESSSLMIVYGGIWGISLVVSLWSVLLGAILHFLKPTGYLRILYPALLWMFIEQGQALGDISLPWARLAMSQYQNLWLLQIIPHTGQLVISGLIVAFNAAILCFLLDFVPDPKPKPYWHYQGFRALMFVATLISANLYYGHYVLSSQPEVEIVGKEDYFLAVVQGNIPQGQKWSTADEYWKNINEIEAIYEDLSRQVLKRKERKQPGLLIWPESALPVVLRKIPMYQEHFKDLARRGNIHFLSGIFDQPEQDQIYNGAVLVEPNGKMDQWYYKRQLVPFGEYFPYRKTLDSIPLVGALVNKINPMHSDTEKGKSPALFQTALGKIGTLICFESVYPKVARESALAGADVLVIITNDGWYRDAIALYQHLGHAVLRALENNRYVLRAGNTGISAFIDNHGRIIQQSLPMEAIALSQELPKEAFDNPQSLYTHYGDWPLWFLFILMLGIELRRRLHQTPEDKSSVIQHQQN